MTSLLGLPVWLVVALVALLPALEASTLVGLAIPGETAVLVGGAVAGAGAVPLWVVIAAAVLGAVVGDQVGYRLGRRYGMRLLTRLSPRIAGSASLDRATGLVRRRGALAVVLGRWAAVLRALVPGVAGMSGIAPVRFTVANVVGGTAWGSAVAVAGYLAGASYDVLARRLGLVGDVVLAVVLLAVAGWLLHGRRSRTAAAHGRRPWGTRP